MNRNQKIIVSIVGITIVLLALLGITYAYYLTRIQGNTNTNSISITTADLSLTYGDGNTEIITSETLLMPGEFEGTKDFTVTNNGNSSVTYGVILEDMINPLKRPGDMKMTLSCSSDKEDGCKGLDETNFPSTNEYLVENTIEVGETHTYELKLRYIEAGEDQSIDMGKTISGKVNIVSSHDTVDMTGEVANYEEGDYVQIGDEPKTSYITSEGKYKVVGLNPGQYAINIYKSDGTLKGTKDLTIKSGTVESISDSEIIITKDTRLIKLDITTINQDTTITTGSTMLDKHNPFKNGTLAYAILDSAKNESYELFTELELKLADVDENGIITKEDADYINKYAANLNSEEAPSIGTKFLYDGVEYMVGDLSNDGTITASDALRTNRLSSEYNTYVKYETSIDFNIASAETDKILSYISDDYGTSYFYRGNVTNNYVLLNNMCFRIVRIEGDGAIKLAFAGEVSDGSIDCSELTETSALINTGTSVIYGYKSITGLTGNTWYIADYENDVLGTGKTSLKESLDSWFDTKFKSNGELTEVGKKIKNDTWCLGGNYNYKYSETTGKLMDDADLANQYILNKEKYGASFYSWRYAAGNRLFFSKTVQLTCGLDEDKISSKVGTLTSDEVVLSGGTTVANNTYYLYQNAKDQFYWTISRSHFNSSNEYILSVADGGRLVNLANVSSSTSLVRPVISLVSGMEISSGNGTIDEPYIVKVD